MYLTHSRLPDVFVGQVESIGMLTVYRRLLANSMLASGRDLYLGSRYDPALSLFPKIITQPDIFKNLLATWQKNTALISRDERVFNNLPRTRTLKSKNTLRIR